MPVSPLTALDKRPEVVCDTECYSDYWSIGFTDVETKKRVIYELHSDSTLNRPAIARVFKKFRVYTFNGNHYDMPMIMLAMSGATNIQLKQASDNIIVKQLKSLDFYKKYDLVLPAYLDHIDVFDVAPGVKLSQKKYGARMNMKRLQELPIDPAEPVGVARRPLMRSYLGNDLDTLMEMVLNLREELDLRNEISVENNVDVRSKSDAQIAETLIKIEVERITGQKILSNEKLGLVKTFSFKYVPPPFIKFKTKKLQDVLKIITDARFFVSAELVWDEKKQEMVKDSKTWGVVKLPQSIKDIQLRIGFTDYKMGIGGLHSKEHRRSFVADENTRLIDRDVRAYYPRLMIKCGYVPEALGDTFLGVFTKFVELRDSYKEKAAKLKKMAKFNESLTYKKRSDTFKIVNNGLFGKTGSPYSCAYSPKLLIHTTLTGQLSLLMLIEELEEDKLSVISANTDGIVTVVPRERYGHFVSIIFEWECATSFQTEEVEYAAVYSRDVNSYIALPVDHHDNLDADIKRKGLFAKAGLQSKHDPTFDICSTAVVNYLAEGFDIETTIRRCKQITQFVGVRQVGGKQGGAEKNGEYLGKMVRWYYAVGERGSITTVNGGKRVAGTTGAKPCMDLPDEFPDDVDYDWYIREAYARLDDIGLNVRNPALTGRSGYVIANLPGQKTVHMVDLQTRVALCMREEKKVREAWVEHDGVPDDLRTCRKCQAERGFEDTDKDQDAI